MSTKIVGAYTQVFESVTRAIKAQPFHLVKKPTKPKRKPKQRNITSIKVKQRKQTPS